ncbi:hypothetical protein KLP28_07585 [Nocardioidaceae bacterium]|nr:hypothetical protein KLP28_07585 [Nocardioidaceae bacterium]
MSRRVAAAIGTALDRMGLDRRLHESAAHEQVEQFMPGASPTRGIRSVVFYLIFFFIVTAIGALGISVVSAFVEGVVGYLPNIIAAILIFVVAALVAGGVAAAVVRVMGDTPTGKIVASVVPSLVMVIAFFMILNQLQIAEEIVTIAFAAVMGALALGLALAFGLGGRDVARRILEDSYAKAQEQREQVREDLEQGKQQAQEDAQRVSDEVRDRI